LGWGLVPRALHLPGRLSTAWATPPVHFGYFGDGGCLMNYLLRLALNNDPPNLLTDTSVYWVWKTGWYLCSLIIKSYHPGFWRVIGPLRSFLTILASEWHWRSTSYHWNNFYAARTLVSRRYTIDLSAWFQALT
jgi:hypothetical protein